MPLTNRERGTLLGTSDSTLVRLPEGIRTEQLDLVLRLARLWGMPAFDVDLVVSRTAAIQLAGHLVAWATAPDRRPRPPSTSPAGAPELGESRLPR